MDNIVLFLSYQQLPPLGLEPLKSFLSWHSTLQGPLVQCFQNFRDKIQSGVVWSDRRGSQDIVKLTTDTKLVCALIEKNTFLHRSLIVKSQHKITELVATLNRKGTSLFASKLPRRRGKLPPNQPENSLMTSVSWQLRLLAKMLYAHKLSQGINRIWSHSLLSAKIEKCSN